MGKMGAWSSFLKQFLENIQNEDYGFVFVENFDAFLGLAPSKLTFKKKKWRVGYVYIEDSFDTIFNMGYGGGAYNPHGLWVGKSPMAERVKRKQV